MVKIRRLIILLIVLTASVFLIGEEFSRFILSDSEVSETVGKFLIQKTGSQLSMIIFPNVEKINSLTSKDEVVMEIRKLGEVRVVELSGEQIKEILEDTGRSFSYDGMKFEVKEGIFAILEGLEYVIDLTKMDGEKVVLFKNPDGSDVDLKEKFKVAVLGPVFQEKDVIESFGDIDQYFESGEITDPEPDMNWQVYFKPFFFSYTIRPGDTLWKLSRRFHTTVQSIVYFNSWIKNPDLIYAFWTLKIHVGKWK